MTAAARARALADVGRLGQAEQAVRAGLAETPADAELLSLLAGLRRLQGHHDDALESAAAAVAAAPGHAAVHIEQAECLLGLDRWDEALASAREAVRLAPGRPEPHRSLARCLILRRDLGAAREAATRAVELAPYSVPDLMTLAEVERTAGRRDAAREATARALAEDPEDPDGRWTIALLDAEKLRVREAMLGLRRLAADHPDRYGAPALTWPIRGLLAGLRRGLLAAVPLTAALAGLGHWWPPSLLLARGAAGVMAFVTISLAARVLIPAGRLPWICAGLLPARLRRAVGAGLVAAGASVPLLVWYATSAPWTALALVAGALVASLTAGAVERAASRPAT
ncbi:tetratricopeptide repeat protein [Actinoplanes sp. NEAU-A12]|uniref:Tetratricopeptide repeat protein n=1 Tax=Actinoplanes sandaracinus TaxID=3045177 RepID=A0ABT6WYQ0_9ACTN|nr:tetratricopeptide repeat protein [Actinoplanes sandaracinus]MDI6104859.1 tetratricopeptide repeat protein [Actinoplanes sandaracinus]